jgi:competence protein ComGC
MNRLLSQSFGMSPRRRHAYSLVELLVILAVMTVGIGLVLPAIQRSRQAKYSSKLSTEAATSPGTGQASQPTPGDEA